MKVLILSCNTGGGHNTAAKALKEVFDSYGDDCQIKDALSFGSQLASDLVCDSYVEIVKKTPELFGAIYKMSKKMGQHYGKNDKLKSPIYLINKMYADDLKKYLIDNKIDIVICCHIFAAEAMTNLKRKHNIQIPFYFIATDYYVSPMLEEADPSKIFIASKDSLFTYTNHGISAKKILATGIPVSQRFVKKGSKEEARKILGINSKDQVFLIMGGSMGFGDTIDAAKYIFDNGNNNTRVIAITGNNKEMYKEFLLSFPHQTRLTVVGFTDKVDLYMEASDVLLSKPGGLSSTEAFVKGIPIIHTAPIPGCETENAQFFTEHHLSLCAKNSTEAGRLALSVMNDEFLRNQIIAAQENYRPENAAKTIVDYIKENN